MALVASPQVVRHITVNKEGLDISLLTTANNFEGSCNSMVNSLTKQRGRVKDGFSRMAHQPTKFENDLQRETWKIISDNTAFAGQCFIELARESLSLNKAIALLGNSAVIAAGLLSRNSDLDTAFSTFYRNLTVLDTAIKSYEAKATILRQKVEKGLEQLVTLNSSSQAVQTAFTVIKEKKEALILKNQEINALLIGEEAAEVRQLHGEFVELDSKLKMLEKFKEMAATNLSVATAAAQEAQRVSVEAANRAVNTPVRVNTHKSSSSSHHGRFWWWSSKSSYHSESTTHTYDHTEKRQAEAMATYAKNFEDSLRGNAATLEQKLKCIETERTSVQKSFTLAKDEYDNKDRVFSQKCSQLELEIRNLETEMSEAENVLAGLYQNTGVQRSDMLGYISSMSSIAIQSIDSATDAAAMSSWLQAFHGILVDNYSLQVASQPIDKALARFPLFIPYLKESLAMETVADLGLIDESIWTDILPGLEEIASSNNIPPVQLKLLRALAFKLAQSANSDANKEAVQSMMRDQITGFANFMALLGESTLPYLEASMNLESSALLDSESNEESGATDMDLTSL